MEEKRLRFIARLDIKGSNVIKGIQMEGLRVVGDPNTYALRYYEEGIDELIYMDTVASLYGRNNLADIVRSTVKNVFVPLTVGGGVRTVEDVKALLNAGADKIAINTAAIKRPNLIGEVSERFGSQCMVLSIEAKQIGDGKWEAYTDNGREKSGRDVLEWARMGVELGAGEILLTSVDREGTQKGFDSELCRAVTLAVNIPVILSGGMGQKSDVAEAVEHGADAIAIAHVLHYGKISLSEMRREADLRGYRIRSL